MYRFFKYIFDIFFASLVLVIISPFFILVSLLILLFDGMPVFFIQERIGRGNKIFKIYKFRTMQNKNNIKIDNEINKHETYLGRLLRNTSIDEIPSLINILKGEMSLIGPRPLLVQYLKGYTKKQLKRHLVRPGITGLAQIKGRNNLTWDERFEFDVYYVEKISFFLDLYIFFMSFIKVIRREGIYRKDNKQMPFFYSDDDKK